MDFIHEEGHIYSKNSNGDIDAEIVFPTGKDGFVDISRTFVAEKFRGKGVAEQLVRNAAEQIRKRGKKTTSSCPYAAHWFKKHPEESDILKK